MAEPNKDAPENQDKPKDGATIPENRESNGGDSGEGSKPEAEKKFTQEDLDRYIGERLARERETAESKAAQQKADAEAEGKRKALKDQEKFKELAESLTTDVAAKDTRIKELEAHEKRVKDLEERLEKVVSARLEGLAKPYQDLVAKLSVEERADWLETNAELLKSGDGKPAGSPASPPPVQRNGNRDDEAAKQARADMRRSTGSRI